ncbi:MAG TPA: hypothetical protein PKH39_07435 [Woeseiaceae bacterium]|nr:hypothetical protein [Woeseiaceae bacterium]
MSRKAAAIDDLVPPLVSFRRDIHAHPELATTNVGPPPKSQKRYSTSGWMFTMASAEPVLSHLSKSGIRHVRSACGLAWMHFRSRRIPAFRMQVATRVSSTDAAMTVM